ncbi:MAG: PEP-CTERM sorting domain-containing protein [Pirellulales bacterium]
MGNVTLFVRLAGAASKHLESPRATSVRALHRAALSVIVTLAISTQATHLSAAIVNGGFETGDLTGWQSVAGFSQAVASENMFGFVPRAGNYAGSVDTYAANWRPSDLSHLRQTFNAGIGDTLRFSYAGHYDGQTVDPFSPFFAGTASFAVWLTLPNGSSQTFLSASDSYIYWTDQVISIPAAGTYSLNFRTTAQLYQGGAFYTAGMYVDEVSLDALSSQDLPFLPNETLPGTPGEPPIFVFEDVPSGQWVDPPMAAGFAYEMTSDSLFTGILDFPTGFTQPFTVAVGDSILGQYGPGQSVDFTSFAGGGVANFSVTGLDPGADPNSPTAFPLRLLFNTNTADFTMQAILEVPEPSSWMLLVLGVVGVGVMGVRR